MISWSKQTLIVAAMGALLPLISCTGETYYHRYRFIEHGAWHRDTLLVYTVDTLFTADDAPLEISLELTSNNSYPYRDLWLLVEQHRTDTLMRADTLRVLMADEKGRRLGSSVGGLHQLSVPWYRFAFDDQTGAVQFRIRHLMSDDPLDGIEKVGVRIADPVGTEE